jgi:hypothetical protein
MPPKSTVHPQRRTRSAAATRLEIAQGKVQATCKQPGAKASASQVSATAPPPSSPAAQRKSRHHLPDPNTASAASTGAKRTTTRRAVSKGNTGASATGCAEGEDAATHSAVANTGASATGCTEGEGAATHSAVASAASTGAKHTAMHSAVSKGNTGVSATCCVEGEGAATHSAVAEGKAPPQLSDSVNTGCTEGEDTATATHSEGAATHSTEADGNAPMPSLLALNTPNVGFFPPSSTVGDMLEDGDLKPAANEDSDSDFNNYEDRDLKPAALNKESDSDYDNYEDGDLNTGGDVLEELTATIMTGGDLKTRGNLLEEPTAKILKKKIPGGAFSPRRESLGILRDFMSKQVSPLFARQAEEDASSPTGENNDFVEEDGGGGQYNDDELFQDDVEEEDMTYYRSVRKVSGHPLLMDGGPPRPDTKDMTAVGAEMAINDWRVTRKAFRDKQTCLLRISAGSTVSDIVFTGVLNERLRTMTEVEDTPLKVDDNFLSKEILLIRTAEEANFSGCSTSSKRSDGRRLQIIGIPHSWFRISANFSPSYGWKVTRCDTRIAQPVNNDDIAQEEEVVDKGGVDIDTGEESEQSEGGDDFEEEGNPDGSDADGSVTIKESKNSRKTRTPIKARWIYPFIKCEIAQTPNMSNREMKNLLVVYVKEKFMTWSLIQNARSFARDEIFGDPLQNVMFSNALVDKIEEGGHDVIMVLRDRLELHLEVSLG